MKTKTITNLFATALVAFASISPVLSQTNLGAACGCPPVGSRTPVNLSTLGTDISVPGVNGNASVLNAVHTVLTCDKTYILDKKIYVDSLKTLTIQPGTLIKGKEYSTVDSATMLIVQRGAQIFAQGTSTCPIVFTAFADPMDGTYGVANRGDWGGIALLGKAYNNLISGQSRWKSTGVGFVEGFVSSNVRIYHGSATPDNNDNSGIMSYVQIRHSGSLVSAGNEIQGLTLGSVGKGTTIDHIDIISSDDDGIELFGGTVDMKYISCLYGADDMIDWDNGWNGRMQFVFGLEPDSVTCNTSDNGFECDANDDSGAALSTNPSDPKVFNTTMIGNGSVTLKSDNTGHAAIMFKDKTLGEISNSIFANFGQGLLLRQTTGTNNVYSNWTGGTLKFNCNHVVNTKRSAVAHSNVPICPGAPSGTVTTTDPTVNVVAGDLSKWTADGNLHPVSITGFDWTYAMNTTNNTISDKYDAIPTTDLATACPAPADGFFVAAPYRGAFAANTKSWMSDWTYLTLVKSTNGNVPCPSDINNDGITNNSDFLLLVGQFNQNCQ